MRRYAGRNTTAAVSKGVSTRRKDVPKSAQNSACSSANAAKKPPKRTQHNAYRATYASCHVGRSFQPAMPAEYCQPTVRAFSSSRHCLYVSHAVVANPNQPASHAQCPVLFTICVRPALATRRPNHIATHHVACVFAAMSSSRRFVCLVMLRSS